MSGDYSYSTALGYSARATQPNQVGHCGRDGVYSRWKDIDRYDKTNISVGYDALSSVSSGENNIAFELVF
jgi:hypothetical protein